MRRVAMGILLGLGTLVALQVAACTPSQTSTGPVQADRSGAFQTDGSGFTRMTPSAAADTPSGYTGGAGYAFGATPTSDVMGAQATPGYTFGTTPSPGVMGAQATPAVSAQSMLRDMDQFQNRLRNLAGGSPTPQDLVSVTQQASSIMGDLDQNITGISAPDRQQLLSKMSDIVGEMANVVQTRARQMGGWAIPLPEMMGTPGPMAGVYGTPTPFGTAAAIPPSGMASAQQMMTAIDQLRDQEMQLAGNQPNWMDAVSVMGRMRQMLSEMSVQSGQMSDQDLQAVVDNMTQATNDLVTVIETYVRQEAGATPSAATPTAIMIP